ncbi:MAG: DUF721 domain-containing protein [Candidatus Omnitrophota bacterium]
MAETGRREPLPLKDIIGLVIAQMSGGGGEAPKLREEEIKELWKKAVGRAAAGRSRPVALRKGKLVVTVEDSSLLYELTLKKRQILEELGKTLKNRIQDIQFRIGDTRE